MTMIHLPATGYRRERWRNGGGWTRQIAAGSLATPIFDADTSTQEWDWRLSIAEIEADGPFSEFPGVDRSLLLLAGAGMDLVCEGGPGKRLSAPLDRFDFAGEARIAARLCDGPTVDFNLMWRREALTAQLQMLSLDAAVATLATAPSAWLTAVHVLEGRIDAADGPVEPGDTLLQLPESRSSADAVAVLLPGRALLIRLSPALAVSVVRASMSTVD